MNKYAYTQRGNFENTYWQSALSILGKKTKRQLRKERFERLKERMELNKYFRVTAEADNVMYFY